MLLSDNHTLDISPFKAAKFDATSLATPIKSSCVIPDKLKLTTWIYVGVWSSKSDVTPLGPGRTSNPLSDRLTKFGLFANAPAYNSPSW